MNGCRFFSLLCMCLLAASCPVAAGIDDGLVAHYPLDGDARDVSGNGYHGVNNGVTFVTGHHQLAAVFNGSSNIRVDGLPAIRSNLTIAAWFRPQNLARHFAGSPLVTRGASLQEAYSLFVDYDFIHVILNWNAPSMFVGTVSIPRLTDTEFHHVALVYNHDEGEVAIFFDGQRKAVFGYAEPLYAQTEPLYFGVSFPGGLEVFRGMLDDVRIYNRALGGNEILELVRRDVVAVSIEVSEVKLCWDASPDKTYQLQCRSNITTNLWTDVGAPLLGNGTRQCVSQSVVAQEQRFYRIVVVNP